VLATLILSLAPAQGTPAPEEPGVVVWPGAVEAPRQPLGGSDATVLRAPRPELVLAEGSSVPLTVRIGDMAVVRGQEENQVQGIGLVTGLSGTGDSTIAARQAILNLLLTQNIVLDLQSVSSANAAVVLVQATLEPGIKPGRQMDVRVSSLYDCESLVGGTLLHTELADMTGNSVYVTAAGPITTGAFSAEGQGATATRNHLTVGTIPLGGKVEREVTTQIVSDHGFVYLDLRALKGSFGNATRITQGINGLYPGSAVAQDAMTVAVRVPDDLPAESTVSFLSSILEREIEPAPFARVVINERTGVIVMGEGVRLSRGAITKGSLTVTIAETPEASQPGPLSQGKTQVLPRTSVLVEEEDRPLSIVNGAVTLQQVVEVLNVLGVSPRDMIQILQLMAQSGMLHAEILVM
jgi:flagellar P-ring protein precursor FlgI